MIAPSRRKENENTREETRRLVRFYIYNVQRAITRTYAWYFVIKYIYCKRNVLVYKQNTHRTGYKVLKYREKRGTWKIVYIDVDSYKRIEEPRWEKIGQKKKN